MSNQRTPGMFARLRSLMRGLFRGWVKDREFDSPEVVYEQAIAERVRQYRELKEAVAGILYMRNKLENEIGERRAEIARLHDDIRRSLRSGRDEMALTLIARKQQLFEELERAEGERDDVRADLARHIALGMLNPLLYALPAFGLLIWFGAGRSLRPLDRLARAVESRAAENLSDVEMQGVPREVVPLVGSLNRLFARLRESFAKERRFTDDAAHELRTPLAAIKTHAQVALAARDAATRQHALESIVHGADRAAHLADQLLTLARLDGDSASVGGAPADLRRAAADTAAQLAPWALDKGVDVILEEGPDVNVRGDAALLDVMLRNLLDNAIRYTPPGGTVRLRVASDAGRPVCEVEDTGPGIPADDRVRVFERFYRVLGTGEEGSGLGLSIVLRIAELHGARLDLDSGRDGRGSRARVTFATAA